MKASVLENEMHPVQIPGTRTGRLNSGKISSKVTLAAYEVYCDIHGPQPAMVDLAGRGCRGGFSTGELICFLYARSFPKVEWSERTDEAERCMENL